MRYIATAGLHRALHIATGERALHVVARQRLGKGVYRLRLALDGRIERVVAKHLTPRAAERNERAARRWLPAVQLERYAPPLLGVAADQHGRGVWHVYEDLGDGLLDTDDPDLDSVCAVVEAVALIHGRFADHPLLADCRLHGADLGVHFFQQNVRDALRALKAMCAPTINLQPRDVAVRDRLVAHLSTLLLEEPARSQALLELGGPQTLLHGDLWTTNMLFLPAERGCQVRLIDWDRAGVGPVCYDLSAFLLRFPGHHRPAIMALYRAALGRIGWPLEADAELNFIFDTCERARFASCVIWPALAVLEQGAGWGFDALAAIADWFDALGPVLPTGDGGACRST